MLKILTQTDKDYGSLYRFVTKFYKHADTALVEVSNHNKPGWMIEGWTHPPFSEPDRIWGSGCYSVVELLLSKDYNYPKMTMYRKRAGTACLLTWQEEFVFVLAHELQHVDQFLSYNKPFHPEVDAEKKAMAVLESYRASQTLRKTG